MAIKDYVAVDRERNSVDIGKIFKKHLEKYDSHTIGFEVTHKDQTIIAYDIDNIGIIIYNTKIEEKDTIQLIMIGEDNKIRDVKSKLEKITRLSLEE